METKYSEKRLESYLEYTRKMHDRVFLLSMSETIAILACTLWQIYYIKKILDNRRIVWFSIYLFKFLFIFYNNFLFKYDKKKYIYLKNYIILYYIFIQLIYYLIYFLISSISYLCPLVYPIAGTAIDRLPT